VKKDRKARASANERKRDQNEGAEVPKKKKSAALETVVTRKLGWAEKVKELSIEQPR
jgi:hypothetical protein